MKNLIALALLALSFASAQAAKIDTTLHRAMAYEKFIPAKITLMDGKVVRVGQANVFLKNSTLLYKSGANIKVAAMANVKYVDFADQRYERLDTLLAFEVDTIGKNRLMCAPQIDLEALTRALNNNRMLDNFSVSDMITINSYELQDEDEIDYPVFNQYFFVIGGKVVRCGDRYVSRIVPKDKRRVYKNLLAREQFDWENPQSLMSMLYLLSK